MLIGWIVTAQDIVNWSATHRRQAQEVLPLLIRRLILATVKPTSINVPTGDSILTGGWDGVVTSTERSTFVPEGISVWEFGTDQNVKHKADSDYLKRTEDPQGLEVATTTFAFVTTRSWRNKDSWVSEKTQENRWQDVRGLNADDLETWLHQCPAVHRWFARLIGKITGEVWDVSQAWEMWSQATTPPCNTKFVVAGRGENQSKLIASLNGEPGIIRVSGESDIEAYAFILAVLVESDNQMLLSRTLIVRDKTAWDYSIESTTPLILIPKFDSPTGVGSALHHGHWVIVPTSSVQNGSPADVPLARPIRANQVQSLVEMGLQNEEAEEVVTSCRGYLLPIRRHRLLSPNDYSRPQWSSGDDATTLLVTLLIGNWDSSNSNDCEIVARLSRVSYSVYEQGLIRLASTNGPPLRQLGSVWQVISRQDMWSLLSHAISGDLLDTFLTLSKEVLGEIDPRLELPPEERWKANVQGKVLRYSNFLRQGMAKTLALLGSFGDTDCRFVGGVSVGDRVSKTVWKLLGQEMARERWSSLSDLLPYLAEASPSAFLDSVEQSLREEHKPVMELFVEEGEWGRCQYAGLLWALECVSWNLQELGRVSRILAKLDQLDPGGRYANRPAGSLREIFLGWLPQTKATLAQRINIFDMLIRLEPNAAWKLLLNLVPNIGSDISTPIYRPRYRDWDDGWQKCVSEDYNQFIFEIGLKILSMAEQDINRWSEIIKILPKLPSIIVQKAIEQIKQMDMTAFTPQVAMQIYNELRKEISRNQDFSDAIWALSDTIVESLIQVYEKFLPQNLVQRYAYLFDDFYPGLVNASSTRDDYEGRRQEISQLRLDALSQIWYQHHWAGIERLAFDVEQTGLLGESLANSNFQNDAEQAILRWLGNTNKRLDFLAKSYVHRRIVLDPNWLNIVREQYHDQWGQSQWVAFCLGIPFDHNLFRLLRQMDDVVKNEFWREVQWLVLSEDDAHYAIWAVEQLLYVGRPLTAIKVTTYYLHTFKNKIMITSEFLASILEAVVANNIENASMAAVSYDLSELIKRLEASNDLPVERLARIEWLFMGVIEPYGVKPITLIREATNNPDFFIHLILLSFGQTLAEGNVPDLPPEVKLHQRRNALHLLGMIDRVPGQCENNEVDVKYLKQWIDRVGEHFVTSQFREVVDNYIGEVLAHSPSGKDGIWPHEAVRDILEVCENIDIERGIEVGRYNSRGVVTRSPDSGGEQERQLSIFYRTQSQAVQDIWPRAAKMLRRMEQNYSRDGRYEDFRAELWRYM